MENRKLTVKQKRFADEYIISGNATYAAKRAGYSENTATETAFENLRKPHILKYVNERLEKQEAAKYLTMDEAFQITASLARGEPKEIIVGFDQETGEPRTRLSYPKHSDRRAALDQYYKIHNISELDKQRLALEEKRIEATIKSAEIASGMGGHIIPDATWQALMNPVYAEHLIDDHPLQIFFGGASSGKSYGILGQRTVRDVMTGKRNYLIVRKVGRTIRNSAFNEIRKTITSMGLSDDFQINQTEMAITHKASGYQILFSGLDDVEKVKSITPAKGVLTDVVVEEATEITYDDFKQLQKRLRGGDESIIKRVTLLFNPILQDHWIYEEFFAGAWDDSKDYFADEGAVIRRTTYKDNRYLTDDDKSKLESETDKYYYDVYTLGKWGVLGNLIFTNWETRDLTELKETWAKYHNGLDFGFFPDPAAFVRVGLNRAKKEVYIFHEAGGQNMTNDELAAEIKPIIAGEVITCDSAEPKSIQELNNLGINAIPARKGQGSVEFGIKWLKKQKIFVDPKCVEITFELKKYKYHEDRNGNVLPKPVDKNNHYIDALRYALEAEMVEVTVK